MSSSYEQNGRALIKPRPSLPEHRGEVEPGGFAGGLEGEVREYFDILKRRAGLIRGVFVAVLALTVAYTLLQDPVYRASALVQVRGADADVPSIQRLFDAPEPTEANLRTHFGLLRSATLAERVIRDLSLDTLEEFNAEGEASRQQIVRGFLDRLVIDPVEESRLVRVSFDAATPERAAAIANAVVRAYGELRVESHESAAQRLALQVDSVESRLADAEAELRAYAEDNGLPYLVEQDLSTQIATRIEELRRALNDAKNSRYEVESRYEIVVRQGRVDIVQDRQVAELEMRLSELRREYARLSATFTDAYPETAELRRRIEHLRGLIDEERARVRERVASDYRLALQREAKIAEAIAAEERLASELGPQSGDYHVLRQAVLANRQLFATLHERRREAEIAASVGSTDLSLIDSAAPPTEPHRPVFAMNLGLGLMLGLVLGVGTAFMRELTDDTIRTGEDVRTPGDLPVLAMIPAVESTGARGGRVGTALGAADALPASDGNGSRLRASAEQRWPRIDRGSPDDGSSGGVLADAFGALRTSVLLRDEGPQPRSILVSSCRSGEGKTTVSVNLAMSLAKLGRSVILVDADLRRPAIHRALGVRAAPGLIDCLDGDAAWRDVVKFSVSPGLDALTSGGATTRAGELIAGERLGAIFGELEVDYDFVIVDAPALFINASDARHLSREVDGVVVVVRSGSTPRTLVSRIPDATQNLLGVVVNDLRRTSLPEYFGDYFADYGDLDGRDHASDRGRSSSHRSTDTLQRLGRWIHIKS